ncbi:MAG: cytochrome c family protein [Rhodoblastus sp.]|nr:cytochrome c family protein [Rhodoblastus sp.]
MNMEINKMAGALLGSLLGVMGLGMFSDVLYAPDHMKKAGYDLPAGEAAGGKAEAAKPAGEPFPVLLAKADAKKGESLVKPCAACHDFTKPGVSKVGPPLYGVVGRAKAHVAGFAYSDPMKAKGGDWSFDELNKFIADPKKDIPGTKMAFAGEKDDAKRADIVAYLRTLSDSPLPLPAADAKPAEGAKPADGAKAAEHK